MKAIEYPRWVDDPARPGERVVVKNETEHEARSPQHYRTMIEEQEAPAEVAAEIRSRATMEERARCVQIVEDLKASSGSKANIERALRQIRNEPEPQPLKPPEPVRAPLGTISTATAPPSD